MENQPSWFALTDVTKLLSLTWCQEERKDYLSICPVRQTLSSLLRWGELPGDPFGRGHSLIVTSTETCVHQERSMNSVSLE